MVSAGAWLTAPFSIPVAAGLIGVGSLLLVCFAAGIPPGPLVGKAYQHLLALRMEHGPLGHDRAVSELKAWYAENC